MITFKLITIYSRFKEPVSTLNILIIMNCKAILNINFIYNFYLIYKSMSMLINVMYMYVYNVYLIYKSMSVLINVMYMYIYNVYLIYRCYISIVSRYLQSLRTSCLSWIPPRALASSSSTDKLFQWLKILSDFIPWNLIL